MSLKKIKTFGLQNLNPAESLQQMVLAYTEYLTIAEQERTKRRDIAAWEKKVLLELMLNAIY
ncbi:MAG: hypothetical protein HC836_47220 [Richelia sp. RM2_1_2]|nr:hypothetical protein [Richelia sp. RM2_1_2]